MRYTVYILFTLLLLGACKIEDESANDGKIKVVCTTSMIGDCYRSVLGEVADVTVLMGAGVDPHLYDPRPSDLKALDEADIIIYNGFHLEGKFVDKFEKLAKTKKVIALSDFVEDQSFSSSQFANAKDPHFWFDPVMWTKALTKTTDSLSSIYPQHQEEIQEKFKNYSAKIVQAQKEVEQLLLEIPENKRILITSHDAFNYFGRFFNFRVEALQGISTLSEAGIKEVTNLVNFIIEKDVHCIFVETSVSQKALKSVKENCAANGYAVSFGEELFSDAMGENGKPEGSYPGMLKANAERIHKGILSHD